MRFQRPAWWVGGLALLLRAVLSAQGQGTFQNLGFESASLVPIPGDPYGRVQFAAAFPGWSGSAGGVPQTAALYNSLFLDTSGIGIIDAGFTNSYGSGGLIQGSFTAVLMAGVLGSAPAADTTLTQVGLVPVGTESLQFKADLNYIGISGSFGVTFGGQTLSLIPIASGPNYTLYGADIHEWAGQTAELDFTAFAQQPHVGDTYLFLDSIQFSNQPVPEPGVFGLWALGAVLVGWRVVRRR
jgi:hypothetical protein